MSAFVTGAAGFIVSPEPCYAAARTGEVHAVALDGTKAEKELGWKPAVDLVDAIPAHNLVVTRHSQAQLSALIYA